MSKLNVLYKNNSALLYDTRAISIDDEKAINIPRASMKTFEIEKGQHNIKIYGNKYKNQKRVVLFEQTIDIDCDENFYILKIPALRLNDNKTKFYKISESEFKKMKKNNDFWISKKGRGIKSILLVLLLLIAFLIEIFF